MKLLLADLRRHGNQVRQELLPSRAINVGSCAVKFYRPRESSTLTDLRHPDKAERLQQTAIVRAILVNMACMQT